MAVSIRLRRMGRKKQPHYRIVVAESEHPRDGRFVESIGYYKPLTNPARLVVDLERVDHWIARGAQPSGTVKSLIGKARRGGDDTVAVGVPDVEAERQKRSEKLAARRADEKRTAEAKPGVPAEALTQVPQDSSDTPAGSSSADATAAEAMAEGEGAAVASAEADEPNEPREGSMVRSSAEAEGDVAPKRKPEVSGAEGEES